MVYKTQRPHEKIIGNRNETEIGRYLIYNEDAEFAYNQLYA